MNNFKTKLENLLKEACIEFEKHGLPYQLWHKLERKEKSGTSFSEEQVIDKFLFPMWLHQFLMNNNLFREVCSTVIQNPDLSKKILIDGMGVPMTDPLYFDGKISHDIIAPFLIKYFKVINNSFFNQALFNQMFYELMEIIHRSSSTYISISPLLNLDIDAGSYQIDPEIRIRKLTTDELEEWINTFSDLSDRSISAEQLPYTYCCIEINCAYKSLIDIDILQKRSLPFQFVNLLNLVFENNIYILLNEETYISPQEPYSTGKSISNPNILYNPGNILKLDDDKISRLKNLWQLLRKSPNADLVRLAFNRWSNNVYRVDESDQILDYWIGLESLFTPDSNQDISYRAAIRIAAFLGETPEERVKIYDDIKHSYGWRSAIIHGNLLNSKKLNEMNKKGTLHDTTIKTLSYLRKAILKLLESEEKFEPSLIEKKLLSKV